MSTKQSLFKIGGVEATILRKNVKNLHLNVLPPVGKVRVSVPSGMGDDAIQTFLVTRISWIKKQQDKFKGQERQAPREYVSGESHYFLGKRYRLEVQYLERKSNVVIKGKNKMILTVRPKSTPARREEVFRNFYRDSLKNSLIPLIGKWQNKINVFASVWGVRKMKTRWGTCNEKTKSISFNLELMKKPENSIQYVIVHELVHLLERRHDDHFVALMDKYLPKWRSEKDELNQFILSHEEWNHIF